MLAVSERMRVTATAFCRLNTALLAPARAPVASYCVATALSVLLKRPKLSPVVNEPLSVWEVKLPFCGATRNGDVVGCALLMATLRVMV